MADEERVTPEEAYGYGPDLDENYDLNVGPGGDMNIESGTDKLVDDLSYRIEPAVAGIGGDFVSRDELVDTESAIRGAIREDPRVLSIERLEINPTSEEIEVDIEVMTLLGLFEQVFNY